MGVTLTGYLRCATLAEAARVKQALPRHIELTRQEPGCRSFKVTQTDSPLVWRVEESFEDAEAFKAHQARAAASDWARQTEGIVRDYDVQGMT